MRATLKCATVIVALLVSSAASAWYIKDVNSDRKDVFCDDNTFVGSMYWNGTNWSDGLRWDPDPAKVAAKMVEAQGTSCK